MSHWYNKNGQLFDTDIRTARKEGYAPSVTEVIQEFSNSYGLDLYKAKQMFLASLTFPRPEGITDEEYFDLVKKDSEEHSEKAKDFGTKLHYNIKEILRGGHNLFVGDLLINKAMEVTCWIESNKYSVIVDFKTQETKDSKFRQPYNSWLFQLAGYRLAAFNFPNGEYIEHPFYKELLGNFYGGTIDYVKKTNLPFELINIMISSTEDIPIKVYRWKVLKEEWGVAVFCGMLSLFRTLKNL
jgi:hypothetical protein